MHLTASKQLSCILQKENERGKKKSKKGKCKTKNKERRKENIGCMLLKN